MLSEPGDVGCADGQARRDVRRVTSPPRSRAGADVDPAVRLVGRRALACALPRARRAVERARSSPRSTSRRSTSARARRHLLEELAAAGGDVIGLDWRLPLDEGWARRSRPRRAGEPRPGGAARPVGRRRARGARRPRRAPAGGRVTSSTSVTGCFPAPTRTTLTRLVELVHERTAPRCAHEQRRRDPDGLRVARPAVGRPRVLRRHPWRASRSGPSCSRISSPATAALGIDDTASQPSPLNAVTEETRAALEPRRSGLPVSPACATGSRGSRPPSSAALDGGRDVLVGLVLAPHWSSALDREVRGAVRRGCRRSRRDALRPRVGQRSRGSSPCCADRVREHAGAHVVFTAHSLPARILDDGDPYRDELLETARLVAERAGDRRLVVLVPERVADGRAMARPRHPRPPRRARASAASPTCSPARSGSCPTTSRSAGISTSRRPSGRASSGCGFARIEMPNADPAFVDVLAASSCASSRRYRA